LKNEVSLYRKKLVDKISVDIKNYILNEKELFDNWKNSISDNINKDIDEFREVNESNMNLCLGSIRQLKDKLTKNL